MKKADLEIKCHIQSRTISNLSVSVIELEGRISDLEIKLKKEEGVTNMVFVLNTPEDDQQIKRALRYVPLNFLIGECSRRGLTKRDFFEWIRSE